MPKLVPMIRMEGRPAFLRVDYSKFTDEAINNRKEKNEYMRRWYVKNRERIRNNVKKDYRENWDKHAEWRRISYLNNKPKMNQASKLWYQKNKSLVLEKQRIWRLEHPEETLERRRAEYYKHIERYKIKWKKWQENNPERLKLLRQRSWASYMARKKEFVHSFTTKEWAEKVSRCGNRCMKCNIEFDNKIRNHKMTLDHILPLNKAPKGYTYTIKDVQPLCFGCNSSKSDKLL